MQTTGVLSGVRRTPACHQGAEFPPRYCDGMAEGSCNLKTLSTLISDIKTLYSSDRIRLGVELLGELQCSSLLLSGNIYFSPAPFDFYYLGDYFLGVNTRFTIQRLHRKCHI